ncbi:hypothetical protein K438DRAFT_1989357 [Mycena galopus ATCC 62051]|nr:hypothetical protein K438DRAFT_1989357 [Mycena galopus ATCC 62051]
MAVKRASALSLIHVMFILALPIPFAHESIANAAPVPRSSDGISSPWPARPRRAPTAPGTSTYTRSAPLPTAPERDMSQERLGESPSSSSTPFICDRVLVKEPESSTRSKSSGDPARSMRVELPYLSIHGVCSRKLTGPSPPTMGSITSQSSPTITTP